LVEINKERYKQSLRGQKARIVQAVLQTIRSLDPPGYFVQLDPEEKTYHAISYQKAIDKVAQALREKPRPLSIDESESLKATDLDTFSAPVFEDDEPTTEEGTKSSSSSRKLRTARNQEVLNESDIAEERKLEAAKAMLGVSKLSQMGSPMNVARLSQVPGAPVRPVPSSSTGPGSSLDAIIPARVSGSPAPPLAKKNLAGKQELSTSIKRKAASRKRQSAAPDEKAASKEPSKTGKKRAASMRHAPASSEKKKAMTKRRSTKRVSERTASKRKSPVTVEEVPAKKRRHDVGGGEHGASPAAAFVQPQPMSEVTGTPQSFSRSIKDTLAYLTGTSDSSVAAQQSQTAPQPRPTNVIEERRRQDLLKRHKELQHQQLRQMEVLRQRHVMEQQRLLQDALQESGLGAIQVPRFQMMLPAQQFPSVPIMPPQQLHQNSPAPTSLMSGREPVMIHVPPRPPVQSTVPVGRGQSPSLARTSPMMPQGAPPVSSWALRRKFAAAGLSSPTRPSSVSASSGGGVSGGFAGGPPRPEETLPIEPAAFPPFVVEVPNGPNEGSATASATTLETDGGAAVEVPPLTRLTSQVSDWLQSFFPLSADTEAPEVQPLDGAPEDVKPPAVEAGEGDEEIPPPLPLARSVSSALLALATSPSRFLSGLSSLWDRTPSDEIRAAAEEEAMEGLDGEAAVLPPRLQFGGSLGSISFPEVLGQSEQLIAPPPPIEEGQVSWGTRMRDQDHHDSLLDDVEETEEEERFRNLEGPPRDGFGD
jgi:hypothetical protein